MKRILLYTSALLLTGIFSCKKYLDVTPIGKIIPTTVNDFSLELNDAYNQYSTLLNKGFASYRSDEITYRSASGFTNTRNQYTWDENSTEGKPVFNWRVPYAIIFYTNHVLKNIDNATEGTQEQKNQLKGEAYLLRAVSYFDLVNIFGKPYNEATAATDKAVPLVTEIDLEAVNPRNSVKEIYTQILTDIDAGLSLLNRTDFAVDSSFKFTKNVANALASRVNLYMKNWQKAIDYAKAVLAVKNTLVNMNTAKVLPNLYNSVETIQAGAFIYNTSMMGYFFVSPDLISKYDMVNDLRFALYYKYAASGTTLLKSGSNRYASTFRVAEQYLNLAEAYAQLKNEAEAKKYLLELKKNRYTPASYAAEETKVNTLTGADLLNAIYDERARELAFEGHRWFDLRRTTQPQILHKAKLNSKDTTYTLAAGDARYTAKIPLEAIQANPKLND